MIRRLSAVLLAVCLVAGAAPSVVSAASVYRTTDAQGNAVFTDRPVEQGERVELEPLSVLPSTPVRDPAARDVERETARQPARADTPFMPYTTFRIEQPEDGETLPTGAAGNVQVTLAIEPALRPDHKVRLLVDGRVSQSALHARVFMLTDLVRGEHTLQAELLDAQGRVRHRSAPVTLYVQRASVHLPANPNNPARSP